MFSPIRCKVHSMFSPFEVESILGWVHSRLSPFWVESIRGWVHSGLSPFGVESLRGWVPSGLSPFGVQSHSGLSPFGQKSHSRFSRSRFSRWIAHQRSAVLNKTTVSINIKSEIPNQIFLLTWPTYQGGQSRGRRCWTRTELEKESPGLGPWWPLTWLRRRRGRRL